MNPLVTIIIPVFNVEEYLQECLNSILNQEYKNLEVILVNDGSVDRSLDIINEYLLLDSRFKLIDKENTGQGHSRNLALKDAKGQYIMFLDSDDYLEENCIGTLSRVMVEKKLECLVYNGLSFEEYYIESLDNEPYFKLDNYYNMKLCNGLDFARDNIGLISPCLKIYNRNFLVENNILFDEGVYGEDVIFWYKVCFYTQKIMYMDYYGYFRRYRRNSVMTSLSINTLEKKIKGLNNLYIFIDNLKDDNIYDCFRNDLVVYANTLFNKIFQFKLYEINNLITLFDINNGFKIINQYNKSYFRKIKFDISRRSNFSRLIMKYSRFVIKKIKK